MEKVCAVIVFLSVYQLAGMLHYHEGPVLTARHLDEICRSVDSVTGVRLC